MSETKAVLKSQRDDARALAVRLEQEVAALKSGCHRAGWEYGTFLGGDPRRFRPDPEASTIDERYRWIEACAAWDRGERPEPFAQLETATEAARAVCTGNVAFGKGSQIVCIPDDATIDRLNAGEMLARWVEAREWEGMYFNQERPTDVCATCFNAREQGHTEACELGRLLAAWRATQEGEG